MNGNSIKGTMTVLYPVSNLERAKTVFAALVGASPQTDESYFVGFEVAGQQLGLLPEGGPHHASSQIVYWHVPDIEAKLAEVTSAGATVTEPVHDVGGGRLVASFTDLDGNVLGLIEDR